MKESKKIRHPREDSMRQVRDTFILRIEKSQRSQSDFSRVPTVSPPWNQPAVWRNQDHLGVNAECRIIREPGYVIANRMPWIYNECFLRVYEDYNRGTIYWTRRFSRSRLSLRTALGAPYCGTSRSVHPVNLVLVAFLDRFPFELERRRYQAHIGRPLFRAQFHCARYLEPLEFAYDRKIVLSRRQIRRYWW